MELLTQIHPVIMGLLIIGLSIGLGLSVGPLLHKFIYKDKEYQGYKYWNEYAAKHIVDTPEPIVEQTPEEKKDLLDFLDEEIARKKKKK